MATIQAKPSYSANEKTEEVDHLLYPLLKEGGGTWELSGDSKGLERTFKFKTFRTTWEFMNVIAKECATRRHHPEWSNMYNTTHIRWTTHIPSGLSLKDVEMAAFCDQQAEKLGEIVSKESSEAGKEGGGGSSNEQQDATLKALNKQVVDEGGACCTPR